MSLNLKTLREDYETIVAGQHTVIYFYQGLETGDLSVFNGAPENRLSRVVAEKLREKPDEQDEFIAQELSAAYNFCAARALAVLQTEMGASMLYRRIAGMPGFNRKRYETMAAHTDVRWQCFLHEADLMQALAEPAEPKPSGFVTSVRNELNDGLISFNSGNMPLKTLVKYMQRAAAREYLDLALTRMELAAAMVSVRVLFLQEYPEHRQGPGNKFFRNAILRESRMAAIMTMYAKQACPEIIQPGQQRERIVLRFD